jgi:Amt family ammonium transporter
MVPTMALCAEEAEFPALDNLWVLIAAFLVFFMQAGFAMVETGFTRAKNAGNIIMKNLMDFSVGSIFYWLFGFAIMFGISETGVLGSVGWFGNVSAVADAWGLGGISPETFLLFQTVFCATAATIVSGAMAERTKFSSYLIYSAVISLVVYPIVGRWTWGGGWLAGKGFVDFAGSTVVHSVGGWAALIGAIVLGPRIGKFTKNGEARVIPGHSLTLGALGVFILWFGWFGFNPGSELAADDVIGMVAVNTNLAAAAGAIGAMVITWVKFKKPDVSMTLNGALAGLVGITAGCANVNATGAAIIGLLAGFLVVLAVEFIEKVLKIDDPVGASSVHGVCGAFGTLMVGFFDVADGVFYGGGAGLLGVQALGVVSVAAWAIGCSLILFFGLKYTVGLRVSEKEEIEGLDLHEHGSLAYGDFVVKSI